MVINCLQTHAAYPLLDLFPMHAVFSSIGPHRIHCQIWSGFLAGYPSQHTFLPLLAMIAYLTGHTNLLMDPAVTSLSFYSSLPFI